MVCDFLSLKIARILNFLLLLDFVFYMFFFFNVDYSVYVIKIALFRISLFLSHLDANIRIRKLFLGLNKVLFKKKKRKKIKVLS